MSTPGLLELMGDTGQAPKPIAADAAPVDAAPAKTEHVELDLILHCENEVRKELLVSIDGAEATAVWLRAAHVQFKHTGRRAPATTVHGKPLADGLPVIAVNLPEWLAREKGLLR